MSQFTKNPTNLVLNLPRASKRCIVIFIDISLCILTVWFAFYLRLDTFIPIYGRPLYAVIISVVVAIPVFTIFGLYNNIFRYAGNAVLYNVISAVCVYGIIFAAIFTAVSIQPIPRTIGIIQPILLVIAIGCTRVFASYWLGNPDNNSSMLRKSRNTLVFGAGTAGQELVAALENSKQVNVVGYLDYDTKLQGNKINGIKVFSPNNLSDLIKSKNVAEILLALPNMRRRHRNEIIDKLLKFNIPVKTLPSMNDLVEGKVKVSDIRDLDISDLLGRKNIKPDAELLNKKIKDKTILITGAGGSIGSQLARKIVELEPDRLVVIDQSEHGLYLIHEELCRSADKYPSVEIVAILASVRDQNKIDQIVESIKPDMIYHAAAYKHVPMVEYNVAESVHNNVWGTLVVARAAVKYKVKNFVLISTDKAVRPTNLMGASKRLSEMIIQAFADEKNDTTFCMVRFGNVLNSSGSVVPKFRQQISDGGPITLTHPDITRYFMTIPEAVDLVIQASALATGGDVFVLDMGDPVKIMDLAKNMVALSGMTIRDAKEPDGDIEIEIIGLRPSEKLYEELLIGDEPQETSHPRILKARDKFLKKADLDTHLEQLKNYLDKNDIVAIRELFSTIIDGYSQKDPVVDWLFLTDNEDK